MENIPSIDFNSPPSGAFPYRFTQDDRHQFRAKIQPVAGQLEVSIRYADTRMAALAARREWEGYPIRGKTSSVATDPEDSKRRAKLRAKGTVKLLALELRVDRLFTFTIRLDGSPVPYDNVLRAWDLFRRSMEKHYPNFRYIATPELQKNGQWHIHAGVGGFLNINILRKLWMNALNRVLGRSLMLNTGADTPGTCNIPPGRPPRGDGSSKAKSISKYISKYIGKSLEAGFNRKKYFHSYGVKVTPAQRCWLQASTRDGALIEVLKAYGLWNSDLCVPAVAIRVWNRDSNSAWFEVPASSIPPPF